MAPRKTERILNLTICLLAAPRFLSRERIRRTVEGYSGLTDGAFERTFERDKDELRRLGVPVEVGSNSAFEDEVGYRISRTDFELPPVEFTAEEAAVVSVAGQVWQQANLAESTQLALAKLRAAGLATDTGRLAALAPTVTAREAAFEPLYQAVVDTTRVSFGYRRGGAGEVVERTVEPWGIVSHKGNWYLIGHDLDRDATRMFKLARITDTPRLVSAAGAYTVPEVDLRELAGTLEPAPATHRAVLAIRAEQAPGLRRGAEPAEVDAALAGRLPTGFDVLAVGYAAADDFAAQLAGYGADVLVLEPAELRDRVRGLLAAVADGGAS
ncbi:helix-turn-helix transcriptional regulator [Enemella evansiae]|uniref:helix-turn-helix transcriptional regulator n=1 Tax=Enemella evansiae TaxID=2016499 RepID=UPI000B95FEAC|nr:WYL domain-containing protein [Enemella evansiae]OYO02810.1 DNA-binding transcriptional regulator [Enemella evansiae]OYO20248.1 DNA-binding transcriptional regulator [Enemella evansiae]